MHPQPRADRRARTAVAVLLAALVSLGALLAGPSATPAPAALGHAARAATARPGVAVAHARLPGVGSHVSARASVHRHGPVPVAVLPWAVLLGALAVGVLLSVAGRTPAPRRTTGTCRVRAPPAVV